MNIPNIVATAVLASTMLTLAAGQEFKAVPRILQHSLRQRLALLEKYESERRWADEYKLISKRSYGEKAEEFAHQMSESPYTKISFLVKETKKSDADADQWFLVGDLRLSEGGETKCFQRNVSCKLGRWKVVLQTAWGQHYCACRW